MDDFEIKILEDDDLPQRPALLEKGRHKIWKSPQDAIVQVLCGQKVIRIVEDFSKENAKEVGGLLLGNVYRNEGNIYIEITECLKAPVYSSKQNSPGYFTFTEETWAEMLRAKDAQYEKLKIVGWFHSHPGHGIFLSKGMDTFIQEHYFNRAWQTAMVYDPHQHHGGFFVWEQGRIIAAPGFVEIFDAKGTKSIISWKNLKEKITQSQPYLVPIMTMFFLILLLTGSILYFYYIVDSINRKIIDQDNRLHEIETTLNVVNIMLATQTSSQTATPTYTLTPSPTLTPTRTKTSTPTESLITDTPSPDLSIVETKIIATTQLPNP